MLERDNPDRIENAACEMLSAGTYIRAATNFVREVREMFEPGGLAANSTYARIMSDAVYLLTLADEHAGAAIKTLDGKQE